MKMKKKKTPLTPLFSMTYDDKNDLDNDAKKDHKHRSYCKVSSKTRCYKRAPPSSSPEIKEGAKRVYSTTNEGEGPEPECTNKGGDFYPENLPYPFVLRGEKGQAKRLDLGKECGPPTPNGGPERRGGGEPFSQEEERTDRLGPLS